MHVKVDPRRRRRTDFLGALTGVADPEEKRKIIGRLFVEVFQREAKKIRKREVARAGHDLSGRDRVGRRQDQEGASPSSRTTTSAACPRRCTSSCSSRCASCSRTRCASSAWRSACRARWCSAIRSPGPGLGVRILGEVEAGVRRAAAARRCDLHRGAARKRGLVRQDRAGVRRVPAGAARSA